jgi:hypothetical protein
LSDLEEIQGFEPVLGGAAAEEHRGGGLDGGAAGGFAEACVGESDGSGDYIEDRGGFSGEGKDRT